MLLPCGDDQRVQKFVVKNAMVQIWEDMHEIAVNVERQLHSDLRVAIERFG